MLVALCFVGLTSLPAFAGSGEPLSVQSCNTRCQSMQTDCAIKCDGDIPCIQGCQKSADSCVEKCQAATHPAPPPET
jgi:hypothetical protein